MFTFKPELAITCKNLDRQVRHKANPTKFLVYDAEKTYTEEELAEVGCVVKKEGGKIYVYFEGGAPSNFDPVKIRIGEAELVSTENPFQGFKYARSYKIAKKDAEKELVLRVAAANHVTKAPTEVKRLAIKELPKVEGAALEWQKYSLPVMRELVEIKFNETEELRALCEAIKNEVGDGEFVFLEANKHDEFYGIKLALIDAIKMSGEAALNYQFVDREGNTKTVANHTGRIISEVANGKKDSVYANVELFNEAKADFLAMLALPEFQKYVAEYQAMMDATPSPPKRARVE